MMSDEFEVRLEEGLKRWASAGEATPNLDELIKNGMAKGARASGQVASERPTVARKPWARLWALRPVRAAAATAALAVVLVGTFPTWAGAVADWPLIGPVVTEIVMQDAGLKWAYENGLIQKGIAEARDGEMVFKVLGVMADPLRTTVIYQISGVPGTSGAKTTATGAAPGDSKPVPATESDPPLPAPDTAAWPSVAIASVDGQGAASWQQSPVRTPLGWVGAISTYALEKDSAELKLEVRYGGHRLSLSFQASRAGAARFAREVKAPVGSQGQLADGVTVTLDSVIYTPAETLVKYDVKKPMFSGGYSSGGTSLSHYIEAGGRRLDPVQSHGGWSADGSSVTMFEVFPAVSGPAKFVINGDVYGKETLLTWDLTAGSKQSVDGAPVTLTDAHWDGARFQAQWTFATNDKFVGMAEFDVVDASGQAYPLKAVSEGTARSSQQVTKTIVAELPTGFHPVAVRAHQVGMIAAGPLVFDLPR